jgi:hypothetical protein
MKSAKSEALNRKKEEKATDNLCKKCGSKKHETKECSYKVTKKLDKEDKVEREVEKEEEEEE